MCLLDQLDRASAIMDTGVPHATLSALAGQQIHAMAMALVLVLPVTAHVSKSGLALTILHIMGVVEDIFN